MASLVGIILFLVLSCISFYFCRYNYVLFNPSDWSGNEFWCRVLHVLTTYFMLTTYFWMLCEGAFLRMFLVKTFIKTDWCIFWLSAIGWVTPAFILIPYILFRHAYENQLCWMDQGQSILFLGIPVIIVIFINIYFLCSVILILRRKLNFENNFNKNNDVTFKSARAVFILVPIFGLHFLLMPIRPDAGSKLEYVYEVIASITTSTQGLSVSFLLCFLNNFISNHIKKTLQTAKNRLVRCIYKQEVRPRKSLLTGTLKSSVYQYSYTRTFSNHTLSKPPSNRSTQTSPNLYRRHDNSMNSNEKSQELMFQPVDKIIISRCEECQMERETFV